MRRVVLLSVIASVVTIVGLVLGAKATWTWSVHRRADSLGARRDAVIARIEQRRWQRPLRAGSEAEDCDAAHVLGALPRAAIGGVHWDRGALATFARATRCARAWNRRAAGHQLHAIVTPRVAVEYADRVGDLGATLDALGIAYALAPGSSWGSSPVDELTATVVDRARVATPGERADASEYVGRLAADPPPALAWVAPELISIVNMGISQVRHVAPGPVDLRLRASRRLVRMDVAARERAAVAPLARLERLEACTSDCDAVVGTFATGEIWWLLDDRRALILALRRAAAELAAP